MAGMARNNELDVELDTAHLLRGVLVAAAHFDDRMARKQCLDGLLGLAQVCPLLQNTVVALAMTSRSDDARAVRLARLAVGDTFLVIAPKSAVYVVKVTSTSRRPDGSVVLQFVTMVPTTSHSGSVMGTDADEYQMAMTETFGIKPRAALSSTFSGSPPHQSRAYGIVLIHHISSAPTAVISTHPGAATPIPHTYHDMFMTEPLRHDKFGVPCYDIPAFITI